MEVLKSLLSPKEAAMFTALGWADILNNTISITPITLYRMAAHKCFVDNKHGKEVESLRRAVNAIEKGDIYRNTEEFDAIIDGNDFEENTLQSIINRDSHMLQYTTREAFCSYVEIAIDCNVDKWHTKYDKGRNFPTYPTLSKHLGLSSSEYDDFLQGNTRKIILNRLSKTG